MSKYTKALNKIQTGRPGENDEPPVKKGGEVFSVAGINSDTGACWERGIPVIKNIQADPRVVMQRFPNSIVAEQYRMLRTSLLPRFEKENAKVIMVSSSVNSEGKTVTSCNLAHALAEIANARVVVVDADLRRGKLAEYLGYGNKRKGLSNMLSNGLSPKEIMLRSTTDNIVVIPRGEIAKNPSELVNSEKFRMLIGELRNHFDYVLIDAPPIMSVADAGIIGRFVDGMLMIIQIGRTPKSVISHANILFKQAGVKLLGYILTNVEFHSADYRYYDSYSYAYTYSDADKDGLKARTRFQLKKAGWNFKSVEERFNGWWDQKVLKKKTRETVPAGEEIEEAGEDQ